jgi:hypothetical protein
VGVGSAGGSADGGVLGAGVSGTVEGAEAGRTSIHNPTMPVNATTANPRTSQGFTLRRMGYPSTPNCRRT